MTNIDQDSEKKKYLSFCPIVEENARSAAWLSFSSLQQFVNKVSISCPIGQ